MNPSRKEINKLRAAAYKAAREMPKTYPETQEVIHPKKVQLIQEAAASVHLDQLEPAKRHKYGSKWTQVDGIGFASKAEARRYGQLSLLWVAGKIHNLRQQVKYELIPKQDGERAVAYFADFVYEDAEGKLVVEDCKGFKTKDYIIKRKLMLWVHKIKISEVK